MTQIEANLVYLMFCTYKGKLSRYYEMTQQAKVPVTKPNHLNLISEIHMVEEENVSLLYITQTQIYRYTDIYNKQTNKQM